MDHSDDLNPAQVKKYLDRRVGDIASLLKAVGASDSSTIREITHRIKGNAALYGFADMGLLAGRIVNQVDEQDLDWKMIDRLANELAAQVEAERQKILK